MERFLIPYWTVLLWHPKQLLLFNKRISPESKPQAKRDLVSPADDSVLFPKLLSLLSNMHIAVSLMIHNSSSVHIHTVVRLSAVSGGLWRSAAMQLCSRITKRSVRLNFNTRRGSKSLFCKSESSVYSKQFTAWVKCHDMMEKMCCEFWMVEFRQG